MNKAVFSLNQLSHEALKLRHEKLKALCVADDIISDLQGLSSVQDNPLTPRQLAKRILQSFDQMIKHRIDCSLDGLGRLNRFTDPEQVEYLNASIDYDKRLRGFITLELLQFDEPVSCPVPTNHQEELCLF